jgi:hypothetical protein
MGQCCLWEERVCCLEEMCDQLHVNTLQRLREEAEKRGFVLGREICWEEVT